MKPNFRNLATKLYAVAVLASAPVSYTHLDVYKRQMYWVPLK